MVRLEANDDLPVRLREERPDIVFNIAEGLKGPNREAHVPAICEFWSLPYTGSDPLTMALCLDKGRTKEVLGHHGIPTAPFTVVQDAGGAGRLRGLARDREAAARGLEQGHHAPLLLPLAARRAAGPSPRRWTATSSRRSSRATCPDASSPARSWATARTRACSRSSRSTSRRCPRTALPIYSYEAKWIWDMPDRPLDIFRCPAEVEPRLAAEIERTALAAYRVLRCRDWARIDLRCDERGVPHVLEVNPLPGIHPDPAMNSCLPKAARVAGLDYAEMILGVLRAGAARHGLVL